MSLDVWLLGEKRMELCRECDNPHEVQDTLFEANITHNLGEMAVDAGIYEYLWRPDELGIKKASELIEPLREGLKRMRADPGKFRQLDASNGWGTYDVFVPWIQKYLDACVCYPDAEVLASR